jgi:hypothetical protein
MIDVHILTLPEDNQQWFEQCMASLRNQPIQLHVLAGTKGHIGQGRATGFGFGEQPYVSLVDPDDWVTPNGFHDCLKLLQSQPQLDGAYTAEHQVYFSDEGQWTLKKAQPELGSAVHHLLVLKREVVMDYLSDLRFEPQYPETRMLKHMKKDGINLGYTGTAGYVWRRYKKRFNPCQP